MELVEELVHQLESVTAEAAVAEWEALPALCERRGELARALAAHPLRNQAPAEQMRRIVETGDALERRIEDWRAEWREQVAALEGQLQLAHSISAAFGAPADAEFSSEA